MVPSSDQGKGWGRLQVAEHSYPLIADIWVHPSFQNNQLHSHMSQIAIRVLRLAVVLGRRPTRRWHRRIGSRFVHHFRMLELPKLELYWAYYAVRCSATEPAPADAPCITTCSGLPAQIFWVRMSSRRDFRSSKMYMTSSSSKSRGRRNGEMELENIIDSPPNYGKTLAPTPNHKWEWHTFEIYLRIHFKAKRWSSNPALRSPSCLTFSLARNYFFFRYSSQLTALENLRV
jgi:hypothetical protein